MPCNYETIRRENQEEYGKGIGRWGRDVLAIRYDDRTHFIFELLQNTEDALGRRQLWNGSRAINFHLSRKHLTVSHFGEPFNELDVRGICGIGESTKKDELTTIGRFGIGFKSVYAFTDRPEIHSGSEDFAIDNFVWPVALAPLIRRTDETIINIPLKSSDSTGYDEICSGLRRLGASTLLFLQQIDEIQWDADNGQSGVYLRDTKNIDNWVRRITVIGQEKGESPIEETWIVFSRPVFVKEGYPTRYVEIAFSLSNNDAQGQTMIRRIDSSPLVVFFPTVVETNLGFRVQGPYRTTPSRDNIPRLDPSNQQLIRETAILLPEALHWLRENGLLSATALQCLPTEKYKFNEYTMFAPLYTITKQVLLADPLLPRSDGGYIPGVFARLARTQDMRGSVPSSGVNSSSVVS